MDWTFATASSLSRRIILLILLFPLIGMAYPSGRVREIISNDFSKPRVEFIAKALGLRIGKRINGKKLEAGIEKLYQERNVFSLFVRTKKIPKGLQVILSGSEMHQIREIGFGEIEPEIVEEVKSKLDLNKEQRPDVRVVTYLREHLKTAFEDRGFYRAEIQVLLKEVPNSNWIDAEVVAKVGEPTRVGRVVITGEEKERAELILERLALRPGNVFTRPKLEESVREINRYLKANQYLTSRVEDTTLDFSANKDEVTIRFLMSLGERYQFEFVGNTVFENVQLRSWMTKEILSRSDGTRQIALLIEKNYRDVGYHFCRVKTESRTLPNEGLTRIRFNIEEGEKVIVDRVWFTGRFAWEESELEDLFFEKAKGVLQRHVYWAEGVLPAIKEMSQELSLQGYLQNRVSLSKTVFSEDQKGVSLYLDAEMGIQTRIEKIEISDGGVLPQEEVLAALPYETGEPVNREKLKKGQQAVLELYQSYGYVDVRFLAETGLTISGDQTSALSKLAVLPGIQYRVGSITIEGNRKTRNKVILRELEFKEGDFFDPKKVRQSEEAISGLGLFSRAEIVETNDALKKGTKEVRIIVREIPPGYGEVGLGGVYEDPRFRLTSFLGVGYRNVMGLNQLASARGEVRLPMDDKDFIPFVEYSMILGYRAPYPFELPFTFASQLTLDSFEIQSTSEGATIQTRARIEGKIEKKLGKAVTGIYRLYSYERTTREALNDPSSQQTENIGSTGPGLIVDFRDDVFNPTKGSYHLLDFEFAHPALLSQPEIAFVMAITRNSFYIPLFSPFSLRIFLGAGYARSLFRDKPLPTARLTNELSLGGSGSIRGYNLREFSPSKQSIDTAYYNIRTELSSYLFYNVSGVVFLDSGQIYPDLRPTQRRDGFGIGIRYTTPVGPLAIDLARGLQGGSSIKFYFTVGTI